ncbi:hypothetical protein EDC04DRAFT_2741966, partial [Pisolithus marmoratus]
PVSYAFFLGIFFFFCGFHLLFSMIWVIGIPGSSGFIQTTPMYAFNNWPGYVSGIIGAAKAELARNGAKMYFTRG